MEIRFTLNGKEVMADVSPSARLLDVLRNNFHLTGVKEGCGEGECGACTVLVNDEPYNSCLTPVINIVNKNVVTIEGFRDTKAYQVIADAFADMGGSQCGFCTPGMILASYAVLKKNPHPSEEEIRFALSGNLCRCTGYNSIVNAVLKSSEKGVNL